MACSTPSQSRPYAQHFRLHTIQGAAKVKPHDINSHLAFSVNNLPAFMAHLDQAKVHYGTWQGEEK